MTPRPNVSEQRRLQILQAAQHVFARMGFHKARMDDIAHEAGVSKGTLYWYYKGKDAIIAALLDQIFSWEMRALQEAMREDGTVAERLRRLVTGSAKHVKSLHFLAPVAFEFYALAGRNTQVRNALRKYYETYSRDLTRLIQEGVEAGEFLPETDPSLVARTIIALFEGLVLLWILDPDSVDLQHQAQAGLEVILNGICPRHSPDDTSSGDPPPPEGGS